MARSRLEFQILGPLEVRVDGASVRIGGPKQRALLALLLLNANRVASRDRLSGELFPAQTVDAADHALRNHVSRLRRVLRPVATDEPRLVARPPGYLLRVEPGELDLDTFENLVAESRGSLAAGDPAAAAQSLRAAEALWKGRPLADMQLETFARVEVERLEELRLAAVEQRIDAELALGEQTTLVSELERLAIEHPFRERFRAQLMLALYRSGRQAEGLEVYRRTRKLLNDELGLEPGVALQQLERAILVQDSALGLTANRSGNGARSSQPDVCPFKGLEPFDLADAEFFFGRERLVEELVARLAEAPLLAVVGPSGSGKSSLVRAGLLPALEYASVLVRPGERPVADLADVVAQADSGERLVLAVDQFEELLAASVAEEERRAFVDLLVEAAWDPDRRTLVVIALRADFVGHLAPYVELTDLLGPNHVLLGPMSQTELRRAIEGPAERTGLEVEPALVDTLVGEVAGEAGGLPLLSTTLLDLWRERKGGSLTLAAYERTGGVRGAVGRHAEAAFRSLTDEQREVARRILLRLVAGGGGEPLTRRRVTRSELDADEDERVADVLAALVESRLLVADDGTVELVHEALLDRWRRLAEWLEQDVQGRLLHRHLTQAAVEWDVGGRDPSTLYRGARLTGALDWAGEHAPDLNQLELDFLDESRAVSAREASRQRRANRRLRALLVAALALLVLSAAVAGFAFKKRSQAQRAATSAVAQRLGAQALLDPNLDRSLLLAREGVNLDDTQTTRSNLLAALLRAPAAVGALHEGSDRLFDEALSPDGRTLAVRGDDGNIAFFDTRTLRQLRAPLRENAEIGLYVNQLPGPLHALAFSPDGSTLEIGGTTGAGPLQSATVDRIGPHTRASSASTTSGTIAADVVFSPDGRSFATGEPVDPLPGFAEVIVVRDPRTGRARAQTRPLRARLAGYTSDGRFLLAVTGKRSSLLLDARTLKRTRTFAVGGAAATSPAADVAAFGHDDGSVTILDLASGRLRTLSGRGSGSIDTVSFSPDGTTLATGADDGTVSIWSVRRGALRETLTGHTAPAVAASFSPDGRTLYTASYDGSVIVWDLTGARRLGHPFQYALGGGGWSGSAVSPDGSLFALSPRPDRVALWAASTRTPLGPPMRGPVGDVNDIAFSRDGKVIAAAGSRHAVVWDSSTKRILRVFPVGEHGASSVAIAPDGLTLVVGRLDGTDAIYDLRTGRETQALVGNGSTIGLDLSPDGKLLASASVVGTDATVWQVASGNNVSALSGGVAALSVRYSPDGKLIAVGDSSGTIRFWRLEPNHRFSVPGQTVWGSRLVGQPLVVHGGGVVSIDFDPSGKTLVTLSQDGSLRLWDLATRKLIGAPLPGSDTVGTVHFFPDGKHVLAAFDSGSAVIWNVDPAAWKAQACSVAGRNLTRAEWTEFLGNRPYRNVCP